MYYGDLIAECNPAQTAWEVNEMLLIVARLGPQINVLEIGTHQGASAALFKKALGALNVISVDGSGDMILPKHEPFFHFIKGRSQDDDTGTAVLSYLEGQDVDFLFIDGGHRYEEVKADFEIYSPLVRPGGIVGFHDAWVEHEAAPDVEVKRLWLELHNTHRTLLIRDNTDGQGGGTGIVFV